LFQNQSLLKMNSSQAKKIQIKEYLSLIDLEPKRIKGNDYWYSSPLRDDKEPSLKVNIAENIWFDFGTGKGGNIIDLVMNLNSCTVSEALSILGGNPYKEPTITLSSFHQQNIKDFALKPIQHVALIEYIKLRRIEIALAKRYCNEAHYLLNDKYYFGVAFKNDIAGYEIRNKYSKVNLFGKNITTIKGNNSIVNVYEGFFDFLSYVQLFPQSSNDNHIILNSVSTAGSSLKPLMEYEQVNLLLDNDQSGKDITKNLLNQIPKAKDLSFIYADAKDVNEFLLMKRKK